jgi:antitoxin VapB
MALNIKDPATDRLARKLAALTGASITVAVRTAIEEKLKADERNDEKREKSLAERVKRIQDEIRALPTLTNKTDDEIIGYNEYGVAE